MDEKYIKAFNAVVTFVNDLWEVFGNSSKASPLNLYRRLICHIKPTDVDAINKALSGFRQFLITYEDAILTDNLDVIPRGVLIKYGTSKGVFLEIQKYIYQTKNDSETREAIRQHLVTISAILEPNEKKMGELEKRIGDLNVDPGTKEGEFITGIIRKAQDTMQGVDTDNPTQAIMGMLSSGVIQDVIVGLQQGVGSGEMDLSKLLGSMQTAIGAITSQQPSSGGGHPQAQATSSTPEIEEVADEPGISVD